MSVAKVAISIDPRLLERLDRSRLARECAKLSPKEEQEMADEGLSEDFAEWPEY
jgi:hypothetical protein